MHRNHQIPGTKLTHEQNSLLLRTQLQDLIEDIDDAVANNRLSYDALCLMCDDAKAAFYHYGIVYLEQKTARQMSARECIQEAWQVLNGI